MKKYTLYLGEESWRYPAMEILQAFDPSGDIVFEENKDVFNDGYKAYFIESRLVIEAYENSNLIRNQILDVDPHHYSKEDFKRAFYLFLSGIFNHSLPWGTLTGIKPVKIAHEMMHEGHLMPAETFKQIQDLYLVSPEKAQLAVALAEREMAFVYPEPSLPESETKVSVYLGVPICPAKCSYCSFVSTVADAKGKLAADYLDALLKEIYAVSQMMRQCHLKTDTLYIGGGTPSVFSAEQIQVLLEALGGEFIHHDLREFTFEAGRPETTTPEKLAIMKDFGVSRICLNPQSMNDDTLASVNRYHTAEDIIKTLREIRKVGFNCVNMDLIVGLAGESPEAFLCSLDAVIALKPENITVHSLAVKHGSAIREQQGHRVVQLYDPSFYDEICTRLAHAAYQPYYLYRQKYTQGSGENIGYCKHGYEGIYNILMMAERQTIIGIGAGSSGKIYDPVKNRFEKVFTVKDIRTYNQRVAELTDTKVKVYTDFYCNKKN